MSPQAGWGMMYLGAFTALRIQAVSMTALLAELTTTDEEAIHVIGLLRDGKEGDRVYPALAWLREQRAVAAFRHPGPVQPIVVCELPAKDGDR